MGEHFTRNTVSVAAWCNKCRRQTLHRVYDRRKGPCLDCIARLEATHAAAKPAAEKQLTFFGGAA
jgi:hypothetical protein